jgi:peroxiredoxin
MYWMIIGRAGRDVTWLETLTSHTLSQTTLLKVDTNCSALSLIPTVNGNTVCSFSTHGQQSAAKGSSVNHCLTL